MNEVKTQLKMEETSENSDQLILGFDFSTQQVKAIALDHGGQIVVEEFVQFDSDLPEYRTQGGVNIHDSKVTSPTLMWVKALDILMEKLRISGIDFQNVIALSGCAQSHGSVYWRTGAKKMLQNANPDKFLHDELAHAFAILDSPVWMDSSTQTQCQNLEEAVGGAQTLADITGSRAYERFTGNQIAKIFQERNEAYTHTERISLISSFACSLFLGEYAPIDFSDGGGMNLLDIRTKDWSDICLKACGTNLREKLGDPVPSSTIVGTLSEYMVERYGFNEECRVVAFTGDNDAALAGLLLNSGDVGVSLGTSDTVFVSFESSEPKPQLTGHLWPNPVNKNAYMALLCYKNGSLTREKICEEAAEGSWDMFNQLLESTPRGNFGNLAMYFDLPEIIPHNIQGTFRFNKSGELVSRFASKEAEVRALIEGQFMAKKIHAEKLGFDTGKDSRIMVCGGASVNKSILQVIADIFGAPVFVQGNVASGNSAAVGCAYRAMHALLGGEEKLSLNKAVEKFSKMDMDSMMVNVCHSHKDSHSEYKSILERFKELEERISTKS